MKLKSLLFILTIPFLISCGSSKKVTTNSPRKVAIKEPKHTIDAPEIDPELKIIIPTPKNTKDYILKYAPIAVREMEKYKVPASITLAQGILESGGGRGKLAIRSNNHFGIKCHKKWKGARVYHDDDRRGECFRKYKYVVQSYEDHSKFLTSRSRYANLFKLRITDYKGWAYGLKKAGYATDRKYPKKLISLIKRYRLDRYDSMSSKEVKYNRASLQKGYYKVKKGDTLYSIARRNNTTVATIKKLNNLKSNNLQLGQQLLIK